MRGLVNLGSTCYFNTAVQCLAHVPALSKHFFSTNLDQTNCEITREYQKVVKKLFLKDVKDPVNPVDLLRVFQAKYPRFGPGQHDAQEVILVLVDVFENSLGKEFITGIFNGLDSQVTVYPGGRSTVQTPFTTLLLDVTRECTLEDLLDERKKPVAISGYKDSADKEHHVAAVCTEVVKWPKVFGFSFSMYNTKFPVKIPLAFGPSHKLFACVIHQGVQMGGHYAVLVRRFDKWYLKDDEQVSEVNGISDSLTGIFYQAWYRA